MDFRNRVKNALKGFTINSSSAPFNLADSFRKFGNRSARMNSEWSSINMTDADMYTGYGYAAINNRANAVADLATNFLMTDADDTALEAAQKANTDLVHPYLELIDTASTFSNYQFWYDISTYLDLEGVYYLYCLRNSDGERYGNILEFKLLSPYDIKRVINAQTKELGGYVENRDGMVRELPKEQIIEIRRLNPFSREDPFSMADAAQESQFTLKQASNHTRTSIQKNLNAPGIISVGDEELSLDPERFANFQQRVLGHVKGDPIFGAGKGAITWQDMQTDLNKSALDKVNEINLKALIAVTGNSLTMFGIEQSGVTRDTAKVQRDLFMSNHVIPQLQLIIDGLNQDYKNKYKTIYDKTGVLLKINNPLGSDKDAEIKENQIKKEQVLLVEELTALGYPREEAVKYVAGEIELAGLPEPKEVEAPKVEPVIVDKPKEKEEPAQQHYIAAIHNLFEDQEQSLLTQSQGALENAVKNVEEQVAIAVMGKVANKFDEAADVITAADKRRIKQELKIALQEFNTIIMPMASRRTIDRRAKEFGLQATYTTNADTKKYIKDISEKTAESHMGTIVAEFQLAVKKVYDNNVAKQLAMLLGDTAKKATPEMIKLAQQKALEGAGRQEIIRAIRSEYVDISNNRAKAVARTETNRAFTQSQFQADQQFLAQNGLDARAYKKWITRSGNPCALCQEMASRPAVPFKTDFIEFGDTLTVTYEEDGKTSVLKQKVNYEPLEAGNLHVNCGCGYQLVIE